MVECVSGLIDVKWNKEQQYEEIREVRKFKGKTRDSAMEIDPQAGGHI